MQYKILENFALVGPSAVGKSTVFSDISPQISGVFIDTDNWISNELNENVFDLFSKIGAEQFRKKYVNHIENFLAMNSQIPVGMCVGGTLSLIPDFNKTLFSRNFYTLSLVAPVDVLIERLQATLNCKKHDAHPLFEIIEATEMRELLFRYRMPFYLSAQIVIDTDNLRPSQVTKVVIQHLLEKKLIANDG